MNPNSLANLKLVRPRGKKVRVNALSQHKLLVALLDGASKNELAEETGISLASIRDYLRVMHKPSDGQNLVHICGWDLDSRGSRTIAVYKWGPGLRDARKPKMTGAERQARHREKLIREKLALAQPLKVAA